MTYTIPTMVEHCYSPQKDSFAERALLLLARNQDEEYTSRDLAMKFGLKPSAVHPLLQAAVTHGLAVFVLPEGQDQKVWRAGHDLPRWYAARQQAAEAAAAADARGLAAPAAQRNGRGGRQVTLPPLSLSAVQFHTGREKPEVTRTGPNGVRISRYEWLFERLHAQPVGASAVLPAQYMGTISASAKKRQKKGLGKYTVRRISLTSIEIWRDA
jgi:hypothetical protein